MALGGVVIVGSKLVKLRRLLLNDVSEPQGASVGTATPTFDLSPNADRRMLP